MSQAQDALQAKLKSLSPVQREALLKKLKQQKSAKGSTRKVASEHDIPQITRTHKDYPLSFAQQRLWFLEQLNHGSAAYNIAAAFELNGSLDADILNQTFKLIIQRHESLRTVFHNTNDGARQQILDSIHWQLELTSASSADVASLIHADASTVFNLETGPLFKARLIRISEGKHVLTTVMHHIISDAWSTQVLMAEASRIYNTLKQGAAIALPAPRLQYLDYALWQRDYLQQDEPQQQRNYWHQQLTDTANLNLATDKPRPSLQTNNGSFHRVQISNTLAERLQKLCQAQGTTLFSGLLATFESLLYRYTQQTDFAIGTPIAGRSHPGLDGLIGFFVNTLAIKSDLDRGDSFNTLLRKVKRSTLEAQSNQDIPFEQLVDELSPERDGSYSPIFQSFFSYSPGNPNQQLQLDGVEVRYLHADTDTAKFDLSLIASDDDRSISCHFEYNTDLFEDSTIATLAEHFIALLGTICQQPDQPLEQLHYLNQSDQQALILKGAQSQPSSLSLIERFEQLAANHPEQLAVVQGQQSLSFSELNSKANQLAHYLMDSGTKTGDFVGICLPPSLDLSIALLACVKAGAAYVPMDPSYPAERLSYMVDNANIDLVLSAKRIDTQAINAKQTIDIDALPLRNYSSNNPQVITNAEDPLYVIYTSGSTGIPKAAVVSHRNEHNLLDWYSSEFQLNSNDKFLVFSAIGFDLTQKNLWAPLCFGAQLHFSEVEWYEPGALLDVIEKQQISWINCAPSAFYPLIDNCRELTQLQSLRKLFFGGETIRLANLRNWIDHPSFNCAITNMYGPTECTDIACSHTLSTPEHQHGPIPIGRPNANVALYILDEQQQLLPRGAIGELYIGGEGVGLGYLHNPQMTDERFIPNPFSQDNDKLYRSGDLVRQRSDGNVEFIARCDDQIKIRGFRIELGEIENQLRQLNAIQDAVVTTQDVQGHPQLIAYLCSHQPLLDHNQYKRQLKQQLPDYMVPAAYFTIDHIPLTPNGKIDRKKLPAVDLQALKQTEYIAPRTPQEEELAIIWQHLLGIQQVGIQDNFFELGGHSLLATQMLNRIREAYDIELPLRTIFEVSTIEGIAEMIAAMTGNRFEDSSDDDEAFEEGIL